MGTTDAYAERHTMRITLFHTTDTDHHYGHIPDFRDYDEYLAHTESFIYEGPGGKDREDISEWFEFPVNKLCGSLLGPSDVDFLDERQYATLRQWIQQHGDTVRQLDMDELMGKLMPYLDQAIDHHTGITIELW